MIIKALAEYIEDSFWTIGENLFVGSYPSEAIIDECTVLLQRGGGVYFALPDRIDFSLQVISRARTNLKSLELINRIYNKLHGIAGVSLPDPDNPSIVYYINTAEANQAPGFIGQDEKGRYEYSVNFVIRIS